MEDGKDYYDKLPLTVFDWNGSAEVQNCSIISDTFASQVSQILIIPVQGFFLHRHCSTKVVILWEMCQNVDVLRGCGQYFVHNKHYKAPNKWRIIAIIIFIAYNPYRISSTAGVGEENQELGAGFY